MPAPQNVRFNVSFDDWLPQRLVPMGEVTQAFERQSQEDKAKGRQVRQIVDQAGGLHVYRGQCSDQTAPKSNAA